MKLINNTNLNFNNIIIIIIIINMSLRKAAILLLENNNVSYELINKPSLFDIQKKVKSGFRYMIGFDLLTTYEFHINVFNVTIRTYKNYPKNMTINMLEWSLNNKYIIFRINNTKFYVDSNINNFRKIAVDNVIIDSIINNPYDKMYGLLKTNNIKQTFKPIIFKNNSINSLNIDDKSMLMIDENTSINVCSINSTVLLKDDEIEKIANKINKFTIGKFILNSFDDGGHNFVKTFLEFNTQILSSVFVDREIKYSSGDITNIDFFHIYHPIKIQYMSHIDKDLKLFILNLKQSSNVHYSLKIILDFGNYELMIKIIDYLLLYIGNNTLRLTIIFKTIDLLSFDDKYYILDNYIFNNNIMIKTSSNYINNKLKKHEILMNILYDSETIKIF